MTFPRYYEDNKLYVPEASWNAIKEEADSVAFRDMVDEATKAIREGKAFVVYRESDSSIILRCDRLSDFNESLYS